MSIVQFYWFGAHMGVRLFLPPYPKSIEEICARIKDLCEKPDQKYIYVYWDQLDGFLHRNGCRSNIVKEVLENIEATVNKLADELEDTLIIVTQIMDILIRIMLYCRTVPRFVTAWFDCLHWSQES